MNIVLPALRTLPGLLGLALLLAGWGVACFQRRAVGLGRGPLPVWLALGVGLLALGGLLAPTLPVQVGGALVAVMLAGWLTWRLSAPTAPAPTEATADPVALPGESAARPPEPSWTLADWGQLAAWALVAPALWFPTLRPALTALALILMCGLLLAEALRTRHPWPRAPYDLALALLLVMAALGAWVSDVPPLTLPKVTGLLLGLLTYRTVLRLAHGPRALWRVWALLLALALGLAAVGLVGGLRPDKVSLFGRLVRRLPTLLTALPGTEGGRVSMNQLGGALLYLLPPALALATYPPLGRRRAGDPSWPLWLWTLCCALLLGGALLLTQSRAAWLAMLAGLLCMLPLRWRWGGPVLLVGLMAAGAAWLLWGRVHWAPLLLPLLTDKLTTAWGTLTLAGRLQVWLRTLLYVRGTPWLGGGLGTFRVMDADPARVAAALDAAASPGAIFDVGLPHAHNLPLQVAYDTGLPGLVAYLALSGLALWLAWCVARRAEGALRALAAGALGALVASWVYGCLDVVALGAKPGVLWWALLALIAALHRMALSPSTSQAE